MNPILKPGENIPGLTSTDLSDAHVRGRIRRLLSALVNRNALNEGTSSQDDELTILLKKSPVELLNLTLDKILIAFKMYDGSISIKDIGQREISPEDEVFMEAIHKLIEEMVNWNRHAAMFPEFIYYLEQNHKKITEAVEIQKECYTAHNEAIRDLLQNNPNLLNCTLENILQAFGITYRMLPDVAGEVPVRAPDPESGAR